MILKSISFEEHEDNLNIWVLKKFALKNINLIVGKNASGKSRTLNVIGGLANIVSGAIKGLWQSGNYEAFFDDEGKEIIYKLKLKNFRVVNEEYIVDGVYKLRRKEGGHGAIRYENEKKDFNFQSPDDQLACVARRDSVQHPFFAVLNEWGENSRHFYFGKELGQNVIQVSIKTEKPSPLNLKETDKAVIQIFKNGEKNHGDEYKRSILDGMKELGYSLNDIGTCSIPGSMIKQAPFSEAEWLYVKESNLKCTTTQQTMSQGMFRALSLLIQLNFSMMESKYSCIIIDDVGEGLDFDRSSSLIRLLIKYASDHPSIQLIMSTNDNFVMDIVPIENWLVIDREGQVCEIYNYQNNKGVFDEFRFTGLSNFDFFTSEFFKKGFDQ